MKLTVSIIIALLALLFALCFAFAGEKYQTYQHPACDCCDVKEGLFVSLEVHHFFTQSRHPLWRDVRANTCTLCKKCHLIFHRRNFKREAPEFCRVFGFDENEIRNQCVKETGSIDGKGQEK